MPNSLLKRTLVVSALVAVGAATAIAPAQATGRDDWNEPDNIAHHGAAGEAPENTLAAIELAFDQGADFAEIEVQRTADGQLIAFQDTNLSRTTNVEDVFPDRAPYFVGDFTLAELRQLDAGSWFGPEFAGEKIPTLREVVREVGYRHGLVLEIRNPAFHEGIEADIAEELESIDFGIYLFIAQRLDHLVVQSTEAPSVQAFHALLPDVEVGVISGARPTDAQLVELSGWADRVSVSFLQVNQALVDRAHELDLEFFVHTVNTEAQMSTYVAQDVDGIATTFPGLLDDVLDAS